MTTEKSVRLFIRLNDLENHIRHKRLQLTQKKTMNMGDILIISHLSYDQKSLLNKENKSSEEGDMERSSTGFCVVSDRTYRLFILTSGIKVNGRFVNNFPFADNAVLIAE